MSLLNDALRAAEAAKGVPHGQAMQRAVQGSQDAGALLVHLSPRGPAARELKVAQAADAEAHA